MEKVIEKIIGGRVEVENINDFLKKQGVVVRLSFGGGRNSYSVGKEIYGIDQNALSEDSKEFWGEHVSDGVLHLLPKERAAKFRAVESRVKKKLREVSIGYGNSFVPLSSFGDFKEYFEKNQEEYFALKDLAVEEYYSLVSRFEAIAKGALVERGVANSDEEIRKILSKVPSKERFESSFKMDMSVSAFPTPDNLDMFDESVRESIKGGISMDEEDLIKESVVKTMNEAVTTLYSVIKSCADHGKLQSRVALGVKNGVSRMATANIIGNEKMEGFRVEVSDLLSQNPDEASEASESILSRIYAYAKELCLEDRLDLSGTSFTLDQLEDLVEMYA